MRLVATDLRSPPNWKLYDHRRRPEWAIVSSLWTRDPFGMAPVKTFPHLQPGVWRANGEPVGELGTFNRMWGDIVDQHPSWGLIEGREILLWKSGIQTVTAVDFTNVGAAEAWTNLILSHFHWAQGIHFDYFSGLGWIDGNVSQGYWQAWDTFYWGVTWKLKHSRPDWLLIGQQYHLGAITPFVDGLYLEESPGHFGLSFAQHSANMGIHGSPENWVMELRFPRLWSDSYQRQVIAFTERNGCLLSWGRDSEAMKDLPA